eukprot:8979438-Alexandrium_andersonii.AAC.1
MPSATGAAGGLRRLRFRSRFAIVLDCSDRDSGPRSQLRSWIAFCLDCAGLLARPSGCADCDSGPGLQRLLGPA